MQRPRVSRATLGLFAGFGVVAWSSAGGLVAADGISWRWIAGATVATFVLVGPLSWLARDRLATARRKLLGVGAAALGFLLLIGLSLSGPAHSAVVDAIVLGAVAGGSLAAAVELVALPDRLCGLPSGGSSLQ